MRLLALLMLVVCVGSAQSLTTVADTLTNPDGSHPNGNINLTWQRFQNNGVPRVVIPAGQLNVPVVNGAFSVNLTPTDTALPPGFCYTANFTLNTINSRTYFYVPTSNTPVNLNTVQSLFPCSPQGGGTVALAQLTNSGASVGQAVIWNGTEWAPGAGGGGGGSSLFSALLGGVNTIGSAMVVGNNSSLTFNGTGVVNANQIAGVPINNLMGNSGTLFQGVGPVISGNLTFFNTNGNLADSNVTAANVIVSTGSYANPAWITSLAGSKITGSLSCTALALTGDVSNTGCAVTVSATNGVAFAASATTDTTNASNISTGTLSGARMSAVNLASSSNGGVTGNLQAVNVNGGLNADMMHYLRGDMVWALIPNGGTVTNLSGPLTLGQLVIGNNGNDVAVLGTLGTTTTLLHGNGSGNPTFGPVVLTTDVSGILPSVNGGTANAFFTVSGPASSVKTYTLPNASTTILTTNAAVTLAQGGTGGNFSAIAKGGILGGVSAGALGILTVGTNGLVLTANSSATNGFDWEAIAGTGTVTSIATTSPITGGTITSTGTIGCATCVTSAAALTANMLVVGAGSQASAVLGSAGTTTTVLHGNSGGLPSFSAVVASTDITGVLPIANGGTNVASQTSAGVNYYDGTKITSGSNFQYNGTLLSYGQAIGSISAKVNAAEFFFNGTMTPAAVPTNTIEVNSGNCSDAMQTVLFNSYRGLVSTLCPPHGSGTGSWDAVAGVVLTTDVGAIGGYFAALPGASGLDTFGINPVAINCNAVFGTRTCWAPDLMVTNESDTFYETPGSGGNGNNVLNTWITCNGCALQPNNSFQGVSVAKFNGHDIHGVFGFKQSIVCVDGSANGDCLYAGAQVSSDAGTLTVTGSGSTNTFTINSGSVKLDNVGDPMYVATSSCPANTCTIATITSDTTGTFTSAPGNIGPVNWNMVGQSQTLSFHSVDVVNASHVAQMYVTQGGTMLQVAPNSQSLQWRSGANVLGTFSPSAGSPVLTVGSVGTSSGNIDIADAAGGFGQIGESAGSLQLIAQATPSVGSINAYIGGTAISSWTLSGGTTPLYTVGSLMSNPVPGNASIIGVGLGSGANSRITSVAFGGIPFFSNVAYGGTNASPTSVTSGTQIGGWNAFAYNGTALNGPIASIRAFANQTQTGSNGGTLVDIMTTPNGSTTQAEVVRFENDGGITVPSTVTGGDKGMGTINASGLFVNGVAVGAGGNVAWSGNSSSIGTSSAFNYVWSSGITCTTSFPSSVATFGCSADTAFLQTLANEVNGTCTILSATGAGTGTLAASAPCGFSAYAAYVTGQCFSLTITDGNNTTGDKLSINGIGPANIVHMVSNVATTIPTNYITNKYPVTICYAGGAGTPVWVTP